MTPIENRLRAELPELADRMASRATPELGPTAATPEVIDQKGQSARPTRRRHSAFLVAAGVAAIAAISGAVLLPTKGEDPADITVDAGSVSDPGSPTTTPPRANSEQRVELAEFGIAMDIPESWAVDGATPASRSWVGDDGWVQVSAADAPQGLAGVVDNLANHRLNPYGSAPSISQIVVDDADARLVLPSRDAPAVRGFPEAVLVIDLEAEVSVAGATFGVLTVFADTDHIEEIASSIRFLGQPESSEDAARRWEVVGRSPDGRFTYRARYGGSNELNGTLMVDDGATVLPALRDPRDEFDRLGAMAFGPDGLVTWQSGDENYGTLTFVGRIDAGGQIIDSHEVIAPEREMVGPGTFNDAGVLAVPTRDGPPHLHDAAIDPSFVMSAPRLPIETSAPLAPVLETDGPWAIDPAGSWYLGDTLATDPACGANTLYKDDADGFARVLDGATELDTVVDVEVSQTFSTGGADTVGTARVVVISTECADAYQGRRLHWGIESVDYGDGGPRFERALIVAPIDLDPIERINSVKPVLGDRGGCCTQVSRIVLDLTFTDGRQEEVTVDASGT